MAPRREPPSLHVFAKSFVSNDIAFRVRVMLHRGLSTSNTLNYLDKVISSLPSDLATELAQKALRSVDLFCERSSLSPSLLHLLVRVLIHDSTTAFQITTFDSYQVRQAVLNRLCDLRHLQIYYNLQYFHENFNISSTLQRLQSLSKLRRIYLSQWCNDEIVHLLGKSCPNLHLLDAQNSLSLTDLSVASLSQCQRLKVLLICSTNISDIGYQKLLVNLPLLERIGPCNRLNSIVAKIKENCGCNLTLSLREYESTEMPDDNVASMCPNLTSVHLYGTQNWDKTNLSLSQITHLKLQGNKGSYLKELLTSSIVHLDLFGYSLTKEDLISIANVCAKLRVLRLNQIGKNFSRLMSRKKEAFVFLNLEELDIPDSVVAFDIVMASPRIRQLFIQPTTRSSPFSPQSIGALETDALLHKILAKNPLQFLHTFHLSTRCDFSLETLFQFIHACPQLRSLGNIQTWGLAWETKLPQIYSHLKKHNLAVHLIL